MFSNLAKSYGKKLNGVNYSDLHLLDSYEYGYHKFCKVYKMHNSEDIILDIIEENGIKGMFSVNSETYENYTKGCDDIRNDCVDYEKNHSQAYFEGVLWMFNNLD